MAVVMVVLARADRVPGQTLRGRGPHQARRHRAERLAAAHHVVELGEPVELVDHDTERFLRPVHRVAGQALASTDRLSEALGMDLMLSGVRAVDFGHYLTDRWSDRHLPE